MDVTVKSEKANSSDYEDLINEQIPVFGVANAPVSQFADVRPVWSYGLMGHYNGKPTITLIAEHERNLNTLEITDNIMKENEKISLPENVSIEYGGDYEDTFDMLPQIIKALMISVAIIFVIILLHYKQISVSLILLLSLLLCIPGAAVGLAIMSEPISLTCTLGLISLMGILVRNAIIMIDYAEQLQEKRALTTVRPALSRPRGVCARSSSPRLPPLWVCSRWCSPAARCGSLWAV